MGRSQPTIVADKQTIVVGLSRGIACVILRLAVLTQYRRVTEGQIDGRTHDDG